MWYNVISLLPSDSLMSRFRTAMNRRDDDGFYDSGFWLELARTFNPKVQIPEEFTKMQARHRAKKEAEQWRGHLNDLVSDYWAEQAAAEIENLWSELGSYGFWDDASWQ